MAEKSRATIISDINSVIVANGAWGISPADLAGILEDMADSYLQEDDGTKEIVATSVNVDSAVGYMADGIKVVGEQQSQIEDAEINHALGATYDQTSVNGALDLLGGTINEIIAAMVAHGLIHIYEPPI